MDRLFLLSEEMRALYRQETYESDLVYIRIMLCLCVFFYSIFALMDVVTADLYLREFLIIRFVYVNPVFIIAIILSYQPYFNKLHQQILVAAYLAAGVGVATMLIRMPQNFSYYGGLFLIFAVGHFLTRIYWDYAAIASLAIIAYYLVGIQVTNGQMDQGLLYVFFYIQFIVICIYGSFVIERFHREKFAQTHALMDDKVLLERENYDRLVDVHNAHKITIFSLAELAESRDHFTGQHIERVGHLCLALSKALPEEMYIRNDIDQKQFIETIELASTLHDIGKISIPEGILMKPGKLTEEEMTVMKQHTTYGYQTLMRIRQRYEKNDFINMGTEICRYHHERWDGTGYPEGLSGQEIPLVARIVAVVDVYDALISERPYKEAFSKAVSLEEIRSNIGVMFDPEIAEVFLDLMV